MRPPPPDPGTPGQDRPSEPVTGTPDWDRLAGPVVDLRSDTVTQPSGGMRAAMAAARVGDDVYREDPTVNDLQAHVAALFGHEDALFVVSGTMANQLALLAATGPGSEVLCDTDAHLVRYQSGALATIGGITTRTFTSRRGTLDVAAVAAMLTPSAYAIPTRVVAVEQTHMRGGGTILPVDTLQRLRTLTAAHGVRLHCDGARIWHAHLAAQVPLPVYGGLFDSLAVCLSKGLGAPAGSLLIGNRDLIDQARQWRARLGGQMRQAGILAAAGLHALRHHLPALVFDHRRAQHLAAHLTSLPALRPAVPASVPTNIVNLDVGRIGLAAADVAAAARRHQVLAVAVTPGTLRLVTHRDLTDADIATAGHVLTAICHDLLGNWPTTAMADRPTAIGGGGR